MFGVRHHFIDDFPQMSGAITHLKSSDPIFAQLLSRYDETDKKIYGLEVQSRPVADIYVGELKKERLKLKDKLYTILNSKR
ncbi:MAG: DUF465 domain-containing protein [Pseudomonadota bacterium]|nr:DUF465 domain-containing protein [Pseudomonadota bacterium]